MVEKITGQFTSMHLGEREGAGGEWGF